MLKFYLNQKNTWFQDFVSNKLEDIDSVKCGKYISTRPVSNTQTRKKGRISERRYDIIVGFDTCWHIWNKKK